MNDYSEFPPISSFKRILRSNPESALLYASLWKHRKNRIRSKRTAFKRKEIKNIFLISPTLFRNRLLSMGQLELISFEETPDYFLIDFKDKDGTYEDDKS